MDRLDLLRYIRLVIKSYPSLEDECLSLLELCMDDLSEGDFARTCYERAYNSIKELIEENGYAPINI